jgi:hypothetical protein
MYIYPEPEEQLDRCDMEHLNLKIFEHIIFPPQTWLIHLNI